MKVCIYGLGAIGGLLAARLAARGEVQLSAIARGATLQALRDHGLSFIEGPPDQAQQQRYDLHASDNPADLGVQDVVILSVKTTALPDVAARIAPLLGPDTTLLSAMNGIPWWFFHGLPGTPEHLQLKSLDPDGTLAAALPSSQVVGTVTHLSAANMGPGVVRHVAGNRIIIGEPGGGTATARSQTIMHMLQSAGFDTEPSQQIQADIWYKLWGNMTVNPISAITGATGDRILDDDYVRHFMSRCMLEAAEVGARIGLHINQDPEDRHQVTRQLGAFRTSMLQDVQAGKSIELDALVGAMLDIAHQVNVPVSNIETLMGLSRLHARTLELYPLDS